MKTTKQDPLEASLQKLSEQDSAIAQLLGEVADQSQTLARAQTAADECTESDAEPCAIALVKARGRLNDLKRQLATAETYLAQLQVAHEKLQRDAWETELAELNRELFGSVRDQGVELVAATRAYDRRANSVLARRHELLGNLGLKRYDGHAQLRLAVDVVAQTLTPEGRKALALAIFGVVPQTQLPRGVREELPDDATLIQAAIDGNNVVSAAHQAHSVKLEKEKVEQETKIQRVWLETIADLPETAHDGERPLKVKFQVWWRCMGFETQQKVIRENYFHYRSIEERRQHLMSELQSSSFGTVSRAEANWLSRHVEPQVPPVSAADLLRNMHGEPVRPGVN